jgi:hypothetical protein
MAPGKRRIAAEAPGRAFRRAVFLLPCLALLDAGCSVHGAILPPPNVSSARSVAPGSPRTEVTTGFQRYDAGRRYMKAFDSYGDPNRDRTDQIWNLNGLIGYRWSGVSRLEWRIAGGVASIGGRDLAPIHLHNETTVTVESGIRYQVAGPPAGTATRGSSALSVGIDGQTMGIYIPGSAAASLLCGYRLLSPLDVMLGARYAWMARTDEFPNLRFADLVGGLELCGRDGAYMSLVLTIRYPATRTFSSRFSDSWRTGPVISTVGPNYHLGLSAGF